jgi:peptidoglycan/LPS O-acetylase OafA/YrhL
VLLVSGLVQIVLVSTMHWGLVPGWMQGYWATREVTSYQFYLVAGMVVAMHLDEFHEWLCSHVLLIVAGTLAAAVAAEVWYYLAADHVASWLGSSSDPFQPIVIPFNIGAIACIYLIGVALVHRRRSKRTRALVQSGSDNSYGIYLAQVLFITIMSGLGWQHLNAYLPWPLVAVITVAVVFALCIGLTELLARTPLAKPLTGRTRVPWRRTGTPAVAQPAAQVAEVVSDAGGDQVPATAAAMAEAIAR